MHTLFTPRFSTARLLASTLTIAALALAAGCAGTKHRCTPTQHCPVHHADAPEPAGAEPTPSQASASSDQPAETQPAHTPPTQPQTSTSGQLSPDDAQPADVLKRTRMPTGLVIDDLAVGTGDPVLPNATITFHAKGWIRGADAAFDDTALARPAVDAENPHDGSPVTGPVAKLLPGLKQGIIGMQPGGVRRVFIPAALGYGMYGRRDAQDNQIVPPNADLTYEIRLIQIAPRTN